MNSTCEGAVRLDYSTVALNPHCSCFFIVEACTLLADACKAMSFLAVALAARRIRQVTWPGGSLRFRARYWHYGSP